MDDKRISVLRDQPVNKAINKLAAPAIIGMLVMAIYNFVDTVFVSWINTSAPSATQVVLPVMLIASAVGLSLGIGGASYISRLLGMKDKTKAEKVFMTVLTLGLIFGIITTIINYIFMEDIFGFFGANAQIMNMTIDYGKFILLGYSFMILNMILNNSLRAEGSAKFSMIGMGLGALLNIILDPIFIFVFGWGISGAAIATTLSNAISFAILFSFYMRKKSVLKFSPKYISTDKDIYIEIFKVGAPTFVKQLLFSYSMKLLNTTAIELGGEEFLSTIGIVIRTITIPSYIIFGFGQGFQPVAGYNYGAKKPKRVMDAFKYTLKVTTIIMIVTAFIFSIFGNIILKIFQTTDTIDYYGVLALKYNSIGLLFLGITNTVTVFFQALGKGLKAMLMSISRQGLFFIPIILIIPEFLGVEGVILSQTFSDSLAFILALALVIPYLRTKGIEKLYLKTH
ncbi:MATE family efflux transporter [Candidatus Izemoplasma sp. B36]|uniref:MATE family efflux transporter n=1 Tax=Candidatus Izemoplasma sp. B36 TaxID=3242468 RepID=UPI003558E8E8